MAEPALSETEGWGMIFDRQSLFHSCRGPRLHLVAMGLDRLLRQANKVGHATGGNLRHLLAGIERPSCHGDAHGKWGIAVKLFGGGEQRGRSELVTKTTGTRFRRNGNRARPCANSLESHTFAA